MFHFLRLSLSLSIIIILSLPPSFFAPSGKRSINKKDTERIKRERRGRGNNNNNPEKHFFSSQIPYHLYFLFLSFLNFLSFPFSFPVHHLPFPFPPHFLSLSHSLTFSGGKKNIGLRLIRRSRLINSFSLIIFFLEKFSSTRQVPSPNPQVDNSNERVNDSKSGGGEEGR